MEYEGGRAEFLFGDVRFLKATREPCPVCGHPTGDCGTDVAKPDHVIGFDSIPSLRHTQTFLVEEDVIVEKQITPFTVSKVILARRGQQIPLDRARELGLL